MRTNKPKSKHRTDRPDLILVGDLHLRDVTPSCRHDDFLETQANKLNWLSKVRNQFDENIPVLVTGDIFHKYNPSYYLINFLIKHIPTGIITIPGNHDLPFHNLAQYFRSGLSILEHCRKYTGKQILSTVIQPTKVWCKEGDVCLILLPFGTEYDPSTAKVQGWEDNAKKGYQQVLLAHEFTYEPGHPPFPGCDHLDAKQLLDKYPHMDLIVTGDNHTPVYYQENGRIVLCPGSFTRQTYDQFQYKPSIYFWYKDKNEVVAVPVPIAPPEEVFNDKKDAFLAQALDTFNEFLEDVSNRISSEFDFNDLINKYLASRKFKSQFDQRVAEKIRESLGTSRE